MIDQQKLDEWKRLAEVVHVDTWHSEDKYASHLCEALVELPKAVPLLIAEVERLRESVDKLDRRLFDADRFMLSLLGKQEGSEQSAREYFKMHYFVPPEATE